MLALVSTKSYSHPLIRPVLDSPIPHGVRHIAIIDVVDAHIAIRLRAIGRIEKHGTPIASAEEVLQRVTTHAATYPRPVATANADSRQSVCKRGHPGVNAVGAVAIHPRIAEVDKLAVDAHARIAEVDKLAVDAPPRVAKVNQLADAVYFLYLPGSIA